MYPHTKNEVSTSKLSKVRVKQNRQTDRQTQLHADTTKCIIITAFAGGNQDGNWLTTFTWQTAVNTMCLCKREGKVTYVDHWHHPVTRLHADTEAESG